MIKTMISHAREDDSFVDYLYEKLDRENIGLDIFVDHKRNLIGNDAQGMIDQAKKSIIFIPVFSSVSVEKRFIINETRAALSSPTTNIFPIKLNCDEDNIPPEINIAFQSNYRVSGKIYADFSKIEERNIKYEELAKAIIAKLIELDMYQRDEFFYQDVEHVDKILSRENPSPAERKIMVDVYLWKEAYQYYFFSKLKRLNWLKFLKIYGFFDKNPKPIQVENQTGSYQIPRWSVLNYLEWCSTQIDEGKNPEIGEHLIEIIRSVSNRKDENGAKIDNYVTDWVFIKILANLPDCFVDVSDIEMIREFFKSRWDTTLVSSEVGTNLLPNLLKQQQKEKALKLFDIVTSLSEKESSEDIELAPLIDIFWLKDLLERNMEKLASICPEEAAGILINRIAEIIERNSAEFNNIEIVAIEEHPQNELHKDRFQNLVTRSTRDLLNALAREDHKKAIELLKELIVREHPIFKRLAISVIGSNWATCKDLYKTFAGRGMLNDYSLKHEIYVMLKDNFESFPEEEKGKIVDLIELGPVLSEGEQFDEKYSVSWKQRWLSALAPSGYARAIELYAKYKKVTRIDPEHPDFSSWIEVGWGPDPSPISIDILLEKSNSEVADYLASYQEEGRRWKAPSKEGLENALFEAVRTYSKKFSIELKPFVKIQENYQREIIRGFRKAWEEKRELEWENVLTFTQQIVTNNELWEKRRQGIERNPIDNVISEIADLITDGTKDDSSAFQQEHLPMAEETLLIMLANMETHNDNSDDLLFQALNSAKGRVLTALINYSLRVARLGQTEADSKWPEKVKVEFSRRLDRTIESDLIFSTTLGRYLPNLLYLDKYWVESNINHIFVKEIEDHWQAAMEGYLLGGRVYSHIYDLISRNNHYDKAIVTDFPSDEIRKRLIHHLCIGYLLEREGLQDGGSPFHKCITQWRFQDIIEMISYLWTQREYLVEKEIDNSQANQVELVNKQRARILDFWEYIFNVLSNKEEFTESEERIASDLARLSCYLETIDDKNIEWLKLSAKYVEKNFNATFFIEYLLRLCDVSVSQVGIVFLEMLEHNTPIYHQDHIRSIVTKLYEAKETETANRICNIYGSRHVDFLRDIYEQYNF
jgi:hypothetical protein